MKVVWGGQYKRLPQLPYHRPLAGLQQRRMPPFGAVMPPSGAMRCTVFLEIVYSAWAVPLPAAGSEGQTGQGPATGVRLLGLTSLLGSSLYSGDV